MSATTASDALLTIVLPTHNRPHFLTRLFLYAEQVQLPYQIRIIDSSSTEKRERNQELVRAFGDRLNLHYEHVDLPIFEKMQYAVEQVVTPLMCFWADDDFQLPEMIEEGAKFLHEHPDYSCFHGSYLTIMSRSARTVMVGDYISLEQDSPTERMLVWSEDWYPTFYGIFRTPDIAACLDITARSTDYTRVRIIPEVMMGQLILLRGKLKHVSKPALAYMIHKQNDSHTKSCVEDEKGFPELYERYRQALAADICTQSGLEMPAALKVADQSFHKIFQFKGGVWKILKKLRRELGRLFEQLTQFLRHRSILSERLMSLKVDVDDERLQHPHIHALLDLVDRYPQGVPESVQDDVLNRKQRAA